MYKLPSQKSIHDAIPNSYKNETELDLADLVFGNTVYKDTTLKGRVQFSNLFAYGDFSVLNEKQFVSGKPHPSYYPLYVKNGIDWNNAKEISGIKRYPTRSMILESNEGADAMKQKAKMLNVGAKFRGRISFFNLRPIELGALLSALTFHENNNCYHNLGFAKSLGYGKVALNINLKVGKEELEIKDYLSVFEEEMNKFKNNWKESSQIQELLAMAIGIPKELNNKFEYLKMDTKPNNNQFKIVKDNNESLDLFSKIIKYK